MTKKQIKIAKLLLKDISHQTNIEIKRSAVRAYCEFMAECRLQKKTADIEQMLWVRFNDKGVFVGATHRKPKDAENWGVYLPQQGH